MAVRFMFNDALPIEIRKTVSRCSTSAIRLYAGSGASDAITSTIIISVPGVERIRVSVSFFSFSGVTSWGLRKSPCLQANTSKPTTRVKGPPDYSMM